MSGFMTYSSFSCLPDAFSAVARRQPNHVALLDPPSLSNSSFTYQEMTNSIQTVATWLINRGIEKGDRIGLIATGRSWWPICDFATMSTGAWTVPIYPSVPSNQVGFIVRHAGMTGIFIESEKHLEKLLTAHSEEPLPLRFIVMLNEKAYSHVDQAVIPWPVYSYQSIQRETGSEEAVRLRIQAISADDPATIVYTSGTTGTPKGVLLTHGNILSNIEGIRQRLDLRPDDIHLSYLPLSHIFERTCGQFIVLLSGGRICYAENIDHIVEDFARVRPTTFTTVPRLLEKVQEQVEGQMRQVGGLKARIYHKAMSTGTRARVSREPVSSVSLYLYERMVFRKIKQVMGGRLRVVVSGGAPLAVHVGRFFMALGLPIYEGYGMTETAPVIAFNSPDAPRVGTVGRRLANVEVRLAEDGELLVRGPNVMPGYYQNQDATAEVFTVDGWMKTGDMAEVSDDGFIRITDRKKHLIVLSTGKKVTPAPIESDMIRSPFIDQACLIGQGYKFVSAIVVPNESAIENWQRGNPGQAAGEEQLMELLQSEVSRTTAAYARFEQPKRVIIAEPFTVDNGMLTPSLKIKINAVIQRYVKEIESIYGVSLTTEDSQDIKYSPSRVHQSTHTVSH